MNKQVQKGFTLIELMIVVAIIGILAAIALPAYQDYTIRSKVTEGLVQAGTAKIGVEEGYASNGIAGVAAASAALVLDFQPTKYVSGMTINAANGLITVQYDTAAKHLPQLAGANEITLTPLINNTILVDGLVGAIDWACVSAGSTTATNRGLTLAIAPAAPVVTRYVPSECK